MTKLLLRSSGLSCALLLPSCNLLNQPSSAMLNQCVTDHWIGTFDTPLSAILSASKNRPRGSLGKAGQPLIESVI